jgi:hypothetical protein
MPELRTLCLVYKRGVRNLGRFILTLTGTGPTACVFRHLEDLRFLSGLSEEFQEEGLDELLRNFVLSRKDCIIRMTWPALPNQDTMDFLIDNVPHFQVCHKYLTSNLPFVLVNSSRRYPINLFGKASSVARNIRNLSYPFSDDSVLYIECG